MKEKFYILIMTSLESVPKGMISNKSALVQLMTWRQQAIIWTNADPVRWRIYAALGMGWGVEVGGRGVGVKSWQSVDSYSGIQTLWPVFILTGTSLICYQTAHNTTFWKQHFENNILMQWEDWHAFFVFWVSSFSTVLSLALLFCDNFWNYDKINSLMTVQILFKNICCLKYCRN